MSARAVRARIAAAWLREPIPIERLGEITLHPHQREAAARLERLLGAHRGALLADDVGLGKTFTALAVAARALPFVVVAPASLVPMWRASLARCALSAPIVSHERLGRSDPVLGGRPRLVIVDEAHRFRNPATRRYARLASLARDAPILLLSATPVHNSGRDLAALLALFLGERAFALGGSAAELIVRRKRGALGSSVSLPDAAPPEWLPLPRDDSVARSLLAISAPVPVAAIGRAAAVEGSALVRLSLLRHWASSHGALRATLRRRLARAGALVAALEAGRHPTRGELASWLTDGESIQLAFPELVASAPCADPGPLLVALRRHADGLRSALRALDRARDLDAERAARIRELRARHPGARIVAFSELAETVAALYRHLANDAGVALLTARGARVAGGRISRHDALVRFAPRAHGAPPPSRAEEITLLLATDLLSEGVNLHDAQVVVHLDLPWTPTRLDQRVGRVRRLGSSHAMIRVFAIPPPVAAERIVRVQRRLMRKARIASAAIGDLGWLLPGRTRAARSAGAVECRESLRAALVDWLPDARQTSDPVVARCRVAAVRSPTPGFLALVGVEGAMVLVGAVDGRRVTRAPCRLLALAREAEGPDDSIDAAAERRARRAIARWLARRRAERVLGGDAAPSSPHRRCHARLSAIVAATPPHRRPQVAALAARARRGIERLQGAGAERILDETARTRMPDEEWLRMVVALAPPDEEAPPEIGRKPGPPGARLVALLLLQPSSAGAPAT